MADIIQFLFHELGWPCRFGSHISSVAEARGRALAAYSSLVFLFRTAALVSSAEKSGLERRATRHIRATRRVRSVSKKSAGANFCCDLCDRSVDRLQRHFLQD